MDNNPSIEPSEVEKFDKLSHAWHDTDGEFKMLHKINPLRLEFIENKIREHFNTLNNDSLKGLDILDVGCGGGLISMPLSQKGANVTAIDASSRNIESAKNQATKQNVKIDYRNTTIEELCRDLKKYDVVICLEVIEHVANIEDFVANLASIIKPGGMLIISTINRNVKSYLLAILMAEYILNWVPKHTHDHTKFLKPSELNSFLSKNNMILKELKGLNYDLFSKKWRLTGNIDINYLAYFSKS